MQRIFAFAAGLCAVVSIVAAQAPFDSAGSRSELLSMDQQIKLGQLITKQTPPIRSGRFSIAMDAIVPADVQLHSLPVEAEQLAPRLRGFGYIVVEEQVAIIDLRTRKVVLVFPRWDE